MSDDSGGGSPQILSADPSQAYAQGLGYYDTGAQTSPVATAFLAKLRQGYGSGALTPGQPIGPGGRDPTTGLPYAWLPYDPQQQLFDSHQHFGPTYNDPNLGELQSLYTEPSKSQQQFNRIGPALFGLGLGAITAGAASPFLGPLLNSAVGYGMTGKIDPLSTGLSFLPGAAGAIDPSLLPYLSAAKGGYAATRGNYAPGAISLLKLVGGG